MNEARNETEEPPHQVDRLGGVGYSDNFYHAPIGRVCGNPLGRRLGFLAMLADADGSKRSNLSPKLVG